MSINIRHIADELRRSVANEIDDLSREREVFVVQTRQVATCLEEVECFTQNGKGYWEHKAPLSANDELPAGMHLPDLERAAIHYFSQDVVQNPELDWFYVDALIAYSNKHMIALGESLAGDQFAGALTHGIRMLLDGKYWMGSLMVVAKLIRLFVLLVIIFFPLSVAYEGHVAVSVISLGGIVYFLLSGHRLAQEYSVTKNKVFERIWDANRVYSLTTGVSKINWDLLERELNDTRSRGVPWLSALDVAVKTRKSS